MREEKKMRDILQITGFIYTAIITIVVDVIAILRFKSSNKDESLLAKEILMGSTFAIVVLVIVLLVSLLF